MKVFMAVPGNIQENEAIQLALGYGANEEPDIRMKGSESLEEAALRELSEDGVFSAPSTHFSNGGVYVRDKYAYYSDVFHREYGWVNQPYSLRAISRVVTSLDDFLVIQSMEYHPDSSLRYWGGRDGGCCASNIWRQLPSPSHFPYRGSTQAMIIKSLVLLQDEGMILSWAAHSSLWGKWALSNNWLGQSPEDELSSNEFEAILDSCVESSTPPRQNRW